MDLAGARPLARHNRMQAEFSVASMLVSVSSDPPYAKGEKMGAPGGSELVLQKTGVPHAPIKSEGTSQLDFFES